jgi:hypothetical protein
MTIYLSLYLFAVSIEVLFLSIFYSSRFLGGFRSPCLTQALLVDGFMSVVHLRVRFGSLQTVKPALPFEKP